MKNSHTPKLLQISCDLNWGSIGHIAEDIGLLAKKQGWDAYVIYGRDCNPSRLNSYKSANRFDIYEHYAEHRLFDNDGLASRIATRRAIRKIEEIKPDIIHLHNLHDHWINYELLFCYLAELKIPLVWTQHDCWSYTGGCGYYSLKGCKQWVTICEKCPMKCGIFPLKDRTKTHFEKKKRLFNEIENMTLVPVSHWLEGELRQSFLNGHRIQTIYNGVNTDLFKPVTSDVKVKFGIGEKKLLIGVATTWSERKGLKDYVRLREYLSEDVVILLVGLTNKQIKSLPKGIIGMERTRNAYELVEIYSSADIVLNLSYEETFGLTTVEGLSCGTPGIVYNSTASPELITPETGIVVEPGDLKGVVASAQEILNKGKAHYTKACRETTVKVFNKDDRFEDYIKLYKELLNDTK